MGIKRVGNNGCLTRKEDGVFVWTDRTLTKLGGSSQDNTAGKQIRFAMQTFVFVVRLQTLARACLTCLYLKTVRP